MVYVGLNRAQREMLASERAFGSQALPVISLKLGLLDFTAEQVMEAAQKVMESADVFTASLVEKEETVCFRPMSREIVPCVLREAMTEEEAAVYMESQDRRPLQFPGELYMAEALPLKEGGTVLYVRFHHIMLDGYGMSLFAQRVLDALSGKALKRSVFFSGIKEPEKDSSQGLSGEDAGAPEEEAGTLEESRRFWLDYFRDAEYEPALIAGSTEGLEKSGRDYMPQEDYLRKLEDFAAQNKVTVPYVLGGAYAVYLAQAAGKREAVFLMARLNRKEEELDTLGCYTLAVPVRVRVEQEDTFGDVCRRLQDRARLASAHKDCGLDFVARLLREDGIIQGSLSEYAFNYYSYEMETELSYSIAYSVSGGMNGHLRWNIFKEEGKLSFLLDYRKGIYGEKTANYFIEGVISILERGLAGERVCKLPVVGRQEEGQLLARRGKEIEIDPEMTIPGLFRQAAALYGQRPALYAGEKGYTFEELDRRSDIIAGRLVEKGVKGGDIVAFMLGRDIRLIPVLLGISKSGAAFLPVDPKYPRDRIKYILADSKARFLISSREVEAASDEEYLEADELLGPDCGEGPEADEPSGASGLPCIPQEQLAYVIYTSGTTGRPKGVMLSHKGIANIVHPDNNPFNRDLVKNGRGIVAIGSICFDISLYEILVPLCNGLFVELGSEKAMLDAGTLAEHIQRHGADILHCTPSRVASYLENPRFTQALQDNVQAMLLAGEQLPEGLVRELRDRYGIRVYNGYGPTETTIGATITEAGDCGTIGMPIANTGILLLNGDRKLVPWGAVGEICVYGSGVGMGYRNRPRETEEKFFLWGGKRLYRTGDLGHFDPEGRLVYHGRNDRQVKLRGLRIELSEIEKVMGAYPGVAQTACILRKAEKREHLAGFYAPFTGMSGKIDKEELRSFMKKRLTAYMVPELLIELEEMPQTPGGKTDLKALAEMPVEYVRHYSAPTNELEKIICDAFIQVLHVEQVGIQDNFFELGGDSLSAVELIAALEKKLEEGGKPGGKAPKLSYESLFRYPEPALLAERLRGEEQEQKPYPIENLDYQGIDEYLRQGAGTGRHGRKNLGNVLITGVTGYLGIHILTELLRVPGLCEKVYCLVRPKGRLSAEKHLKNILFYYAETDFSQSLGEKWEVLEGDVTEPGIFRESVSVPVDTIINSAANVAHYAQGDELEQVNKRGVDHLIEYALSQNALFCQISTVSVGGLEKIGGKGAHLEFSEENLHIGQIIYNQYIYSKYMAEYELLRAAAHRGLDVKIMRVGNLQGRSRDGEFQMNLKSNAFTRRLFAYMKMGAVPETVYGASVNFSPVDETAHMILALARADTRYSAFHVYPSREVAYASLFEALEKQGYKIEVLKEEAFEHRLRILKQTREGRSLVEGLLTESPDGACAYIPVSQRITNELLETLGESWRPVTQEYLEKYLSALVGLSL